MKTFSFLQINETKLSLESIVVEKFIHNDDVKAIFTEECIDFSFVYALNLLEDDHNHQWLLFFHLSHRTNYRHHP